MLRKFVLLIVIINSYFIKSQPKEFSLKKALRYKNTLKSIDLSGLGLDSLPHELAEFSQLERINLSGNNLSELPNWFVSFIHLKSLDLSSNSFSLISSNSFFPDSLLSLNLSNNKLVSFKIKSTLNECNLSNNNLISDSIDLPSSIIKLDLSKNPIRYFGELPISLIDLKASQTGLEFLHSKLLPHRLKKLDLSRNKISSISGGMPEELEYLNLSHNQIKKVKNSNRMPKLSSLDISFNFINNLKGLKAPNVKTLIANNNLISEFPLELIKRNNLVTLNLSENQIMDLDSNKITMDSISSLRILILRDNYLRSLPDFVCKCMGLIELDVASNYISNIPSCIINLTALKKVNIDNNNLSDFPIDLTWLENLEYLSLSYNAINELPDDIGQMQRLKYLFLMETDVNKEVISRLQSKNLKLKIRN